MANLTFFNVWQTESSEAQQALLDEMRADSAALSGKRGFLDLMVWAGQERDHRIVVKGEWQSHEAFAAGVMNDPGAQESRARFQKLGTATPGIFVQSLHVEPSNAANVIPDSSPPVVRVSNLRCDAADFQRIRSMMADAEAVLRPGIEAMRGLIAFYAGADEANCAFTNTSIWRTLEDARQLDRFEPMLELGRKFAEAGARFDRPITNHTTMWSFGPLA